MPALTFSMFTPVWVTRLRVPLPEYNRREDGYGGALENRVRFVREMLEVTRDEAGSRAAVALRISLEELQGKASDHYESEAHGVVSLLSDVPDLWDVNGFEPHRLWRLAV